MVGSEDDDHLLRLPQPRRKRHRLAKLLLYLRRQIRQQRRIEQPWRNADNAHAARSELTRQRQRQRSRRYLDHGADRDIGIELLAFVAQLLLGLLNRLCGMPTYKISKLALFVHLVHGSNVEG